MNQTGVRYREKIREVDGLLQYREVLEFRLEKSLNVVRRLGRVRSDQLRTRVNKALGSGTGGRWPFGGGLRFALPTLPAASNRWQVHHHLNFTATVFRDRFQGLEWVCRVSSSQQMDHYGQNDSMNKQRIDNPATWRVHGPQAGRGQYKRRRSAWRNRSARKPVFYSRGGNKAIAHFYWPPPWLFTISLCSVTV